MAKIYNTYEEYLKSTNVNIFKLDTMLLQEFYMKELVSKVFIIELANGDKISLNFSENDFCHLIVFSYFGYDCGQGRSILVNNPRNIKDFSKHKDFSILLNRIKYFRNIVDVLTAPKVFLYRAENYPEFNYKSIYFAVAYVDGRVLKVGIAKNKNNSFYGETYLVDLNQEKYNYYLKEEMSAQTEFSEPLNYLYLPNAAVLKAGAFNLISERFKLRKLHPNSHLYTSGKHIPDFPGRSWSAELIKAGELKKGTQYNIISRNHPLTPEQIKKKYGLRDGGDLYLIFTQSAGGKQILRCTPV